jgi:hypothetical protein
VIIMPCKPHLEQDQIGITDAARVCRKVGR